MRFGRVVAVPLGAGPLVELLLDLRHDVGVALPVEAEVRRPQGLAVRRGECRQARRKRSERVLRGPGLAALAPLPGVLDLLGARGRRIAEDVRVALDHLARDALRDGVDAEPAALFGELREKEDLEEQVAQLVAQGLRGAAVERGERLVGLLEQVRLQGFEGLLAVPRALAPQAGDERDEPIERFGHGPDDSAAC